MFDLKAIRANIRAELEVRDVKPREPNPCLHLPYQARMALVRASQTPITNGDQLARVRAINQASADARAFFPEYFKKV